MARKITFAKEEFYHLYNRGVDKRKVFENDSDYKRFSLLLYLCNDNEPLHFDHLPNWRGSTSPELIEAVFGEKPRKLLVAIGAYCLMPNHFHLLVREISDSGISTFMHKLSTAYTMYFNHNRNKRTGALFQGRFRAQHVDSDTYLKYLFSYIHLNPVKLIEPQWKERGIENRKEVEKFLNSHPYSSYLDYLGTTREFGKILHREQFPEYFPDATAMRETLYDWLSYRDAEVGKLQ